jgi:hypothetical protein
MKVWNQQLPTGRINLNNKPAIIIHDKEEEEKEYVCS